MDRFHALANACMQDASSRMRAVAGKEITKDEVEKSQQVKDSKDTNVND